MGDRATTLHRAWPRGMPSAPTERELEWRRLAGAGLSRLEIAARFNVSRGCVDRALLKIDLYEDDLANFTGKVR